MVLVTEEEPSSINDNSQIIKEKPSIKNILKNKSYMLVFGDKFLT